MAIRQQGITAAQQQRLQLERVSLQEGACRNLQYSGTKESALSSTPDIATHTQQDTATGNLKNMITLFKHWTATVSIAVLSVYSCVSQYTVLPLSSSLHQSCAPIPQI